MIPLRPPVTLRIVTEKMSENKGITESFAERSTLFAESFPKRHFLIGSDQAEAWVYSPHHPAQTSQNL
jgi:hypothetical protein